MKTDKRNLSSFLIFIISIMLIISCNTKKSENYIAFTDTDSLKTTVFELDSLQSNDGLYDSLMKLPQLDKKFLNKIFPLLDGNMISKDITTFHLYKEIKLNDYKGIIVACLSNYNTKVGDLYLIIVDYNEKIIGSTRIAGFFNEAGGEEIVKTIRRSVNEFYLTKCGDGVLTDTISYEFVMHSLIKFENNKLSIKQIDSTYKEITHHPIDEN